MHLGTEDYSNDRNIPFIWMFFVLLMESLIYLFPNLLLLWVSLGLTIGVWLFQHYPLKKWGRFIFVTIEAFLICRYFFWRTLYTLNSNGIWDGIAIWTLYIAEVYSIIYCLWGIVINFNPTDRKVIPLQGDPSAYPTVDVFIPTYNEPEELIKTTLIAASQINYPKNRFKIYLCDDGGTDAKRRNFSEARQRYAVLQKLCEEIGIIYMVRKSNEKAKAGNLNHALQYSTGELILVLDTDHVPATDILQKTVGYFQHDPMLALLQTPQFFINPDPIERNLQIFEKMPKESELFYRYIQRGLDRWNASFFCGSAAILKRKCLEELGGFSGDTVTEDAETSMELHALGYNSAYLPIPLIAGLAPETIEDFIRQRTRWAQGMIQLLLLKKPWSKKGLSFMQKLCYTGVSCFWFFSLARIIFLLAPIAFLVFGVAIYRAEARDFIIYAVPYLLALLALSNFFFGKVRWFFVSELYEILQSFYCLGALIQAFLNPRSPTFRVTPKNIFLEEDFVSSLSFPFYVTFLLMWMGIIMGVMRIIRNPMAIEGLLGCMFWAILNAIWITTAIGALYERRQVRKTPRIPAEHPIILTHDARQWDGICQNLSTGGASVFLRENKNGIPFEGDIATLKLKNSTNPLICDVRVRYCEKVDEKALLGLEFLDQSLTETSNKIHFILGQSKRWRSLQDKFNHSTSTWASMRLLMHLGFRATYEHGIYLLKNLIPYHVK